MPAESVVDGLSARGVGQRDALLEALQIGVEHGGVDLKLDRPGGAD